MPHSTPRSADDSSLSCRSSHEFAEGRTDPEESLAEDREYVTVMGPASQVTVAAAIAQTYLLSRQSLPVDRREDRPVDKIKFTGFIGINLLHRRCQLPEPLLEDYSLHTIGVPGEWAASGLPHFQQRTCVDLPVYCSHSGLSSRKALRKIITPKIGSDMLPAALTRGQVFLRR